MNSLRSTILELDDVFVVVELYPLPTSQRMVQSSFALLTERLARWGSLTGNTSVNGCTLLSRMKQGAGPEYASHSDVGGL